MGEIRKYRVYLLSVSDHIRWVTAIEAGDDASACLEADFVLQHSDYAALEVWDERRLVCHTNREQHAA